MSFGHTISYKKDIPDNSIVAVRHYYPSRNYRLGEICITGFYLLEVKNRV